MYSKYCTGCGLCQSAGVAELKSDEKGFYYAKSTSKKYYNFCKEVCPSSGKQIKEFNIDNTWGKTKGVFLGYSNNKKIRFEASSGGVLTSLCLYLLKESLVDGIIHVGVNPDNPIDTLVVCSTTIDEVVKNCGSRYSSSSPLINIHDYLGTGKKYCFIGKPCDVAALKNYSRINSKVNDSIKYMFSFFCAGAPSRNANLRLMKGLKIKIDECESLKYRGNGWPGYATAISKSGKRGQMPYEQAWGQILGRDIRLSCRFCIDGIGECADVSCGDAWYLDEQKKPLFEEADGRNVVFCRTEKGLEIFNQATKKGYIISETYKMWEEEINYYQKYQLQRRTTMLSSIMAMKTMFQKTPRYKFEILWKYSKNISFKEKIRRYFGTIKRILNGKI